MNLIRKGSIKQKLMKVSMLTICIVLLLTSVMLIANELIDFRQSLIERMGAMANTIGTNSTAALMFNDDKTATETLSALKSVPNITCAVLYSRNGDVLAQYIRDVSAGDCRPHPVGPDGYHIGIDYLDILQHINLDNESIGTLYIQSDLKEIYHRIKWYLVTVFMVMMLSIATAFVLMSRLQKIITKPLSDMADVMHSISGEKDYSVRVAIQSQDEVGILGEGFNEMLSHIQKRDAEIELHREHLQDLVTQRTEELERTNIDLQQELADRKQAEKALRESEDRYRNIIENMLDVYYRSDREGKLIMISPSGVDLLGYNSVDDFIGKSLPDTFYFDPEERDRMLSILREKGSVRDFEFTLKHRDGTPIFVSTSSGYYYNERGEILGVEGLFRDMTERKRTGESLRESEERFRSVVEKSSVGIAIVDDMFLCTYVNKECCNISGYLEQEILGKNLTFLLAEESKLLAVERYQRHQRGEDIPAQYEFSFVQKTGQKRIGEVRSAVYLDSSGKVNSLLQVIDITERRQAEEEKRNLEERLQRAEKMEALGQLAGGVAHDLNNVLGVLSGYSELLLLETPKGHRSRGHAEKILQSTEKGAAIIDDLLTLARRGVVVSDVINLNSLVSDFIKTPVFESMKDYHPRVTFRTEYDENLLNIKASPIHLEKTLMNLISNAAESISGSGMVTIRTESRYLDKPLRGYDEAREGDYAVLTVSDTGMGIPAENREKIFEPFYTKKTMGKSGTGLGLAIVWGTVKDHNGYIDVRTEIGKGTTFTLYFPVTREELIAPQQKVPITEYMGKGESVLVVDDIAEQRDVASGLLTRLGYEVHVVSSGEEAVAYLKGNKVDILVLDMIMPPGIDGLETYERVLSINPKQKAIIVSGFSETDRAKEAQRLGAGAYVKKPYVIEKIGVAIRDELTR